MSKIIGESYNEAGNKYGPEQGLQTCPMVSYIWCHSRRYSLVVEKTVKFCEIIIQFFGLLEEIHTFTNRHRHGTFIKI